MCTRKCCNCIEINVNKEEDRFRYLWIFFFCFFGVFLLECATNSIGDYTEAKIMFDSIAICAISTTKKYFFEYYTASKLYLNPKGSDYIFIAQQKKKIFFSSLLSLKICAWVSVCVCVPDSRIWPNVANRFFLHSFPVLIITFDCISRSI